MKVNENKKQNMPEKSNRHILLVAPVLVFSLVVVFAWLYESKAAVLATVTEGSTSCNVYDEPTVDSIQVAGNSICTSTTGSAGCFAVCGTTSDAKITCATGYEPYEIASGLNAGWWCAKAGTAGAKTGQSTFTWGTLPEPAPVAPSVTEGILTCSGGTATQINNIYFAPRTACVSKTGSPTCSFSCGTTNNKKVTCPTGFEPFEQATSISGLPAAWYCAKAGTSGARAGESSYTFYTPPATSSTTTPTTTQSTTTDSTTTSTTPLTTTTQAAQCTENIWECTEWNACSILGLQKRTCKIVTSCKTATNPKPKRVQECTPETDAKPVAAAKPEVAKPEVTKPVAEKIEETKPVSGGSASAAEETKTETESPKTLTADDFRDIDTKKKSAKHIKTLVTKMLELKNYEMPKKLQFKAKKKAKMPFAAQIAVTVAGQSCGTDASKLPKGVSKASALEKACISKAVELGFIKEYKDNLVKTNFYELLMNAGKLPIDQEPEVNEVVCKDAKNNDAAIKTLASAKTYGMLKTYKQKGAKGYCLTDKALTRGDAALIGVKAIEAVAGLQKD